MAWRQVTTAAGVAVLSVASGISILSADEYVDSGDRPTVVRGMHGCEEAHLATGIHAGDNLLLCTSNYRTNGGPSSRIVDGSTTVTLGGLRMLACPTGYAVKGVHIGRNVLACERAGIDEDGVVADTSTVRAGMHACPRGMLMKGLHVGRNVLACVPAR
jgi:hypothetical protein